jgi:beta-1,4-N-acetylglucosaminyltransferase
MIFVTVGTTLVFDELIEIMDQLVATGKIQDQVICQIGNGSYIPEHCDYFRFKPSVDDLIEQAQLVICHGGTGSTLGVLAKGKKFIAVANPRGIDNHQSQFLQRIAQIVPILWTQELQYLPELIQQAESFQYDTIEIPCLVDDLNEYITGN